MKPLEGTIMATLTFSPLIERYFSCPPLTVFGDTVKEILDAYLESHSRVRDYLLDERGCLRPKLAVFIDGALAQDRIRLSDPVHANAQVFVFAQLDCNSID
jgi:molybdopterin synthase sulfur carrier subunit